MKRIQYRKYLFMGFVCILLAGYPPKEQRPNILFAIMDDATYTHFGAYGCQWMKTPNFDRVAQQGVLFTRAYTPNAKCAPSRASILTGRNSWQLEEAANHWALFPEKFKTYSEALSENGYHVGYTGKGWAPGVAGEINGKKRLLTGKKFNTKKTKPPTNSISKVDYAANFIDFLDKNKRDKPFCFWFGSREPHRKYEYGSGITKGGKNLADIDEVYSFWPDNERIRTDVLDYAYEIEYFDEQLGKILDELEKRGELNNTVVVVTSDNGMPFPRIKGQEYELSNHMPLAMMWLDGIKYSNRVVDDFVSFIDFTPTFLELAGITPKKSGMKFIQGKSLMNLLYSSESGILDKTRDHVLIGKERHDVGRPHNWGYPIRGIVKGDYLYLHNFEPSRWPAGNPETGYLNCDGSPTKTVILNQKDYSPQSNRNWKKSFGKRPKDELYNISQDPECITNLAEDPKYEQKINSLKEQLFAELKEQKDPRMFGNGAVFDSYKYGNPKGIDFYERYMNQEKLEAGWVNPTDFEKK